MNENRFNTKLARGSRSLDKSVCYNTQLNSINQAFSAIRVNSAKKTHFAGRQAGAREAEMAGLSHDHIQRVGRWNSESMENNYLTCLPRTAIRVIQEFPEEKGCFWLPRALVTPPLSLQRMIFPWAEEWQERMRTEPSVQTICGGGFLRTIILQDAVLLLRQLGTHEMFKSAEFVSFAENLNRSKADTVPPAEVEIQRVVPEINARISDLSLSRKQQYRRRSLQRDGKVWRKT